MQRVCEPSPDCEAIYGKMFGRYQDMANILQERDE